MIHRASVVAYLLLLFLFAGCSSGSERVTYGYDVTVAGRAEILGEPHIGMLFQITRLEEDHRIWPVLSLSGLEACPREVFNKRLGYANATWQGLYDLDCDGLVPRQRFDEAGWRVRMVDAQGRALAASLSAVRFDSPPPRASANRSAQWRLAGHFNVERFSFEVPGFEVRRVTWDEDLSVNRPALAELIIELEALPNVDHDVSPQGENPQAPEPAELRSLLLELAGDPLPRRWPRGIVWLRALDELSWRAFELHHRKPADRGESIPLPTDLVGRDIEVQVLAREGELLVTLPIEHPDGSEEKRTQIPGFGSEAHPLKLRWPRSPSSEVDIQVLDSRGAPIANATVALQLISQRQILDSTSALSGAEGWTRHVLVRSGAQNLRILCTKAGWTSQVKTLGIDRLETDLDCTLRPLRQKGPPQPAVNPTFFQVQVLDSIQGGPVDHAKVSVSWPNHAEALAAIDFGDGFFALPTPIPAPQEAELRVEAPCFGTFERRVALPLEGPIPLSYRCRRVGLSLRLLQQGSRRPIVGARQARARVVQADEILVDGIGFDHSGYSEVKDFLFEAELGPLRVEVEAPGFAIESLEIEDLRKWLGDGTIAGDFEITMRPDRRGIAVLLNAAERWSFYPRARDAVVEAVADSFSGDDGPDLLVLGLLSGSTRKMEAATFTSEGGAQLAWLQGLSATGGQLTPSRLGPRLLGLDDRWPVASSWQVVLVIPHNTLAVADRLPEDEKHRLVDALRARGIKLHVIEDGGRHPDYDDLTSALGGWHVALTAEARSAGQPEARVTDLKKYLSRILDGLEEDASDAP